MQLAQQFPGQSHLVRGSVVSHVQPFHILHQRLLVVFLPEQVVALGKQVLNKLEQEGLSKAGTRGLSRSPSRLAQLQPSALTRTTASRPLHPPTKVTLTSYSSCFRGSVDLVGKRDIGWCEPMGPMRSPRAGTEVVPGIGFSHLDWGQLWLRYEVRGLYETPQF